MKTVSALFESRVVAVRAVDALVRAGHRRESISVVLSRPLPPAETIGSSLGRHAAEGAGIGGAMGGVVGFVALGLAAIVPGFGLFAAGPLVSALVGAGAGGTAGTLAGALVGAGLTDVEAARVESCVSRGEVLVAVDVTDESARDALDTFVRLGGSRVVSEAA